MHRGTYGDKVQPSSHRRSRHCGAFARTLSAVGLVILCLLAAWVGLDRATRWSPSSESDLAMRALDGYRSLSATLPEQYAALLEPGNSTVIPAAAPTAGTVFFLHGLASNAAQVLLAGIPLLEALPRYTWILPNAEARRVDVLGGVEVLAWFDIVAPLQKDQNTGMIWDEDESGMRASVDRVQGMVLAEIIKGTPPEKIVLGGFSQGCVISLLTLLSLPMPLGGTYCLSGWLGLTQLLQRTPTGQLVTPLASRSTPIFWGHGLEDLMVPPAWGTYSRQVLGELGYLDIETHEYPGLMHWTTPAELSDLAAWISSVVPNHEDI